MGTDIAVDGAAADGGVIPGVCHTCRVQKPLRSKHCKFAKKCVLKFDHFWYADLGLMMIMIEDSYVVVDCDGE